MKINELEKLAEEKVNLINLEISYIKAEFEEEDLYRAVNEEFEVDSYGGTREEAIENAKIFLKEYLIHNSSLLR